MFTGLIQEVGQVQLVEDQIEGKKFVITCPHLAKDIAVNDSVAVNGVCLTAISTNQAEHNFTVQCVHTSLQKSSLGQLAQGDLVNLELAMSWQQKLGGHIVQGHVNDVGQLIELQAIGENFNLTFKIPATLARFCISEGSLAIDGVSLTIAKLVDQIDFSLVTVTIIPHTWHHTNFAKLKIGSKVNLEVDVIAKYVERLLTYQSQAKTLLKEGNHSHV
jgi:riboflavin synthase